MPSKCVLLQNGPVIETVNRIATKSHESVWNVYTYIVTYSSDYRIILTAASFLVSAEVISLRLCTV